jgi:iron complex outermembrane receptor protein
LAGATFNALDNYVGKSTSYAAYAQTTYTPPILDGNLDLTGGVRFTRDEKAVDIFNQDRQLSHRFNALSGDFTINYRFSPDVMGYFRFANSYKAGGFNARDPGPGYQPEYANNFEGGLKSDWFNKHLRVNADIFYTEYTNQQISTFVALTGNQGAGTATITVNAGASTYFGGELEATIIPADGWEINTSFGYTDANYQQFPYAVNGTNVNVADIAKFPYFSKASFNTGIQYTFDPMPWGDLSARADFAYKSGQVFHPNPLQDPLEDVLASQSQTDLGANITMAHIPTGYGKSEFTAEVYGRNLLDQHLRLQAVDFSAFAPGGFGNDTYSRGRVLGFSLKVDY